MAVANRSSRKVPSFIVEVDTAVPRVASPTTEASAASAARLVANPCRSTWRCLPQSAWKPASTRNRHLPSLRKIDPRAAPERCRPADSCAPLVHLWPVRRSSRRSAGGESPADGARGGDRTLTPLSWKGGLSPPRLPVPPPGPGAVRWTSVAVDAGEHLRVDEVRVVRVAVDVAADERAQRHDRLSQRPLGVEHAAGQRRADALALERRVDLRVHEVDAAASAVVHGEAGELAVEAHLEAVLIGDVGDDGRAVGVSHALTLRPAPRRPGARRR